uniref:Uncharacterized protein n=1 Tax=Glossina pallidipes TaxID=7398 RepID=A0A1A9ZMY4_GLOPL
MERPLQMLKRREYLYRDIVMVIKQWQNQKFMTSTKHDKKCVKTMSSWHYNNSNKLGFKPIFNLIFFRYYFRETLGSVASILESFTLFILDKRFIPNFTLLLFSFLELSYAEAVKNSTLTTAASSRGLRPLTVSTSLGASTSMAP